MSSRSSIGRGAGTAWRFMAQARHVGSIVLVAAMRRQPSIRRDGTYLVTGGLSGLGPGAWRAGWPDQGAGRVVLVGRRGVTAEAAPLIEAWRARGAQVVAQALDVTDALALSARCLRLLRHSGPPLRGVIHSAGVLADASVLQQDAARFARPFRAKVLGAHALDAADPRPMRSTSLCCSRRRPRCSARRGRATTRRQCLPRSARAGAPFARAARGGDQLGRVERGRCGRAGRRCRTHGGAGLAADHARAGAAGAGARARAARGRRWWCCRRLWPLCRTHAACRRGTRAG